MNDVNPQVWWYVSRSAGIVAWVLVTLSVCWGLFISTKAVAKASVPARLLDLHRFLGGFAVIFTGVHLVGLVADNYVYFGWSELFVPMASTWKAGAVAWGIVAFYLLIAVELTSLAMKRLPRRLWLTVHRSSFLLFVFGTYHGLLAGTDHENVWYRMSVVASVNVVAFLTILLIMAKRKAALDAASASRRTVSVTGSAAAGGPG